MVSDAIASVDFIRHNRSMPIPTSRPGGLRAVMSNHHPNSSSAPDWLTKRRRLDSLLRLQAAMLMGDPATAEAVRVLAEALTDADAEVRELAAAALAEFGPDARTALPELMAAAGDESPVVRRRAVRALGCLGNHTEEALPVLIAATDDPDSGVALQAVATVGDLGPAAASAVPALMAVLWTGDTRSRAIAGVALARIGAAAVPALTQALKHPSADVRCKAAQVLAKMGAEAKPALAALERLCHSNDDGVRESARQALTCIRG